MILDRFGRPKPFRGRIRTRSGWLLDTRLPRQSRSWGALGAPRAARSCPKASPERAGDAPRVPGATPRTPGSAVCIAQRNWKRLRIDFFNVFGRRAAVPRCVSYRPCQYFIDVGRFARRTLAARKNLKKTAVSGSKVEARGVLGTLG